MSSEFKPLPMDRDGDFFAAVDAAKDGGGQFDGISEDDEDDEVDAAKDGGDQFDGISEDDETKDKKAASSATPTADTRHT